MKSEVTVPLSRPIQAHGEELMALTLREPTGKDLRTGMPYRILADGEMVIDAGVVATLISSLCGIPPSSVDQLSALDFQEATAAVLGFFRKPVRESS